MSNVKKGNYGYSRVVAMPYEQAVERITATLKEQGFGILTEIDVKATMKKKLDLDVAPYKILGACNPQFASQAIAAEPAIGALLPCNVVVRVDAAGKTVVELMDPLSVMKLVGRPEVETLATEVRRRLDLALGKL